MPKCCRERDAFARLSETESAGNGDRTENERRRHGAMMAVGFVRRILLIGSNGQVGWELQRTLPALGELIAVDRQQLDLADPDAIRRVIRAARPTLVVNAAAYTAVDKAESEPDLAMAINGTAPGVIAEEARRFDAAIVHYSTDYVFDGTKDGAYVEDDRPNPLNVYGRTKLAGEQSIQAIGGPYLILRTSWVYSTRGHNFLLTMLRLAAQRDELRVVDDQVGSPTWSRAIATATTHMIALTTSAADASNAGIGKRSGVYHLTAASNTSWYGFARAILEPAARLGITKPVNVIPVPTAEYPLPARRPLNSRLSLTRIREVFGIEPASWRQSLAECLHELAATTLPSADPA